MEVEARMKRNYIPPSMGYPSGYQSPPHNPRSPTQGSITAGTPNIQQIPNLEPVSIPKTGSIMTGTPMTQATSPFTPTLGQFSPNYGAVVTQGSIVTGTPMHTGFDGSYSFNANIPNFIPGSITSGTPASYQNTTTTGYQILVSSAQYTQTHNNRQRKFSGPQRMKLMLSTVQEMGKYFVFVFGGGGF